MEVLGWIALALFVLTLASCVAMHFTRKALFWEFHKHLAVLTIFTTLIHAIQARSFEIYGVTAFVFMLFYFSAGFLLPPRCKLHLLRRPWRCAFHISLAFLAAVFVALHLWAVGALALPSPAAQAVVKAEEIILPAPNTVGVMSVEETMAKRRSIREYQDKEIPLQVLSQLLWAAQGITDKWGGRTAPSAGAIYPLEVYVAAKKTEGLIAGVYLYKPATHSLEVVKAGDVSNELSAAAAGQEWIRAAPLNLVIAAEFERTTSRYGERGVQYVYLEAGHAAQNVYLQATALNMGNVVVGAFVDSEVQRVLSLPEKHKPIYVIPVGFKV